MKLLNRDPEWFEQMWTAARERLQQAELEYKDARIEYDEWTAARDAVRAIRRVEAAMAEADDATD